MEKGFGYWRLDEEEGYIGDFYGVIDLDKMLFFETDKEGRRTTGKTFNLRKLKGWERQKPEE